MNRKILLVEPNYKNKYPPMGLMKISTYYKMCGDSVTFFKGNLQELALDITFNFLKEQLYANDSSVVWEYYKPSICMYLQKGNVELLDDVPGFYNNPIIEALFQYYRQFYYRKEYFKPEFRIYDRVGITTLFTFYWDITIKTINFVKLLCKKEEDVMVGGIMASILPDQIREATGLTPYKGALDRPGILDNDNDLIVDILPLDYSILEEIDYVYPASNAYFAYMTRGCVNKCSFCAVPKLEPDYKDFIPVSEQVKSAEAKFGARKDLLLLDNNVLASPKFNEIIDDIKKAGFTIGSTYIEPNKYEIAIQNLRNGYNDSGYIKSCVRLFREIVKKYGSKCSQTLYNTLKENQLFEYYTATKEAILSTYDIVSPFFSDFYSSHVKKRYVDFNQGIDARLVTSSNMRKLAEIPIRPVRIAFDHWNLRKEYEKAIRTAVKYGHKNLSNYMLYNFTDKPVELYWRLKLNVELSEELNASIYSFPMKYHPIEDPLYFSNRDYIGIHWNRKFIRSIQAILNSTKGKVGNGYSFFCKAFGTDEQEFFRLLYMPEKMIIYRLKCEKIGITQEWWSAYTSLSDDEQLIANRIIAHNDFTNLTKKTDNKNILALLHYYCLDDNDIGV